MTTKAELESALSDAQGARENAIAAVLHALIPPRSGAPSEHELYPMTPELSRALWNLKRMSGWCTSADADLKEFTASTEAKSRT